MADSVNYPLRGENLITLQEAANDFGGISIPLVTLKNYIYQGVQGVKLESVWINRRYTSREAIQRFIARKQGTGMTVPQGSELSHKEVEKELRKYGIVK